MKATYPFTEADMVKAHDEWSANCGPNALAFALQIHLEQVRGNIPEFEKKKFTSPTMMKAALRNLEVKWQEYTHLRIVDAMFAPLGISLCRIQWCGPWTEPGANPKWAYRQTHWIATWQHMEECGVLGEMQFLYMVFDINGGIMAFDQWKKEIVPLITRSIPRANGEWFSTHIWRINR